MDKSSFNVYLEQLREGHTLSVNEKVPADFLDVAERDLSFTDSVSINGEVYLAGDNLILHFVLIAQGIIPCSICNEPVHTEIHLDNFYHAEPVSEIRGGIYNFRDVVREAILLEAPPFTECNNGKCAKRKEIKKYLTAPEEGKNREEGFRPFADL
ncbi:MAG: hypothetical protein H0X51_07270 [Parachlamydiaceae bacterium]|nr:hypothetical protein [Parachlamydiaceae bacterium]